MLCDYDIDWQAWATLAAGGMAVLGAVVIAWRQNGLKRLEIKISLLDRRLTAITGFAEFFRKHSVGTELIPQSDMYEIYNQLYLARLVFPKKLADEFKKCIDLANHVRVNFETAKDLHDRSNHIAAQQYRSIGATQRTDLIVALKDLLKDMIAHAYIDLT